MLQAVCCSDHAHCCPHGYTCNLATSSCDMQSQSVPWSLKVEATPSGSVHCPGGKTSCPDGSTCCKLISGRYGCCPYKQVRTSVAQAILALLAVKLIQAVLAMPTMAGDVWYFFSLRIHTSIPIPAVNQVVLVDQ